MNNPKETERSAQYNARMQGLVQGATSMASSAFQQERSPARTQMLMKKVFQINAAESRQVYDVLEALPQAQRAEMTPQCGLGCDHCCYQWVRATVVEVLVVYAYIREHYSQEQLEELHGRLKQYCLDFHSKPKGSIFSLGCPLLIDHRCSVYEGRPLICRGTTSLDAELCRLAKENPSSKASIPVIKPLLDIAAALRLGLGRGLHQQGMAESDLVLGLGLLVLFDDPDAVDKYFAGEKVFKSAYAPDDQYTPVK